MPDSVGPDAPGLVPDSAAPGAFGPAPDGAPLTEAEVEALPEGTPVIVIWSGGNGPHRYLIVADRIGMRYVVTERERDNPRMRYYNPLTFIGDERFHSRVWRAES